ncbi:hypothetical protein YC2023_115685 [Brassica napus]
MMGLLVCDSEIFSPDLLAFASATGTSFVVLSFVRALLGAGASSPLVSDDTYTISLLVQPAVCCYLPRSTLWCKPWHPYPRPSPPDLPVLQRILCIWICGSFLAPSNAIRFYFSPSSFSPQVSQICGSLVAGFVIRSDILFGWYYEALVTAIDLLYVLVNVQSFFHLSCCLGSSQSFKMFAALFLCGLGSFVTILKVSNVDALLLFLPIRSIVSSMEVFRFISSYTNLYSDTQDSPTIKNSLTFFQRVGHSMFTGSYSLFDPLSFPLLLYMLIFLVVVLMLWQTLWLVMPSYVVTPPPLMEF